MNNRDISNTYIKFLLIKAKKGFNFYASNLAAQLLTFSIVMLN